MGRGSTDAAPPAHAAAARACRRLDGESTFSNCRVSPLERFLAAGARDANWHSLASLYRRQPAGIRYSKLAPLTISHHRYTLITYHHKSGTRPYYSHDNDVRPQICSYNRRASFGPLGGQAARRHESHRNPIEKLSIVLLFLAVASQIFGASRETQ